MPDEPPEAPGKDRLLPDEAKSVNSGDLDDLRHWIEIYRELHDFKAHLLDEVADQRQRVRDQGRVELDKDRELLERERERLDRRLRFWEEELERRSRS